MIGIAAAGQTAAVQVFPLRDGRLVDRHTFYLENPAGQDVPALAEAFCLEYYGSAPSVPPLVVVPPGCGGDGLGEYLSTLRGSRVEVREPLRGEKRRLQELAQANAELALAGDRADSERRRLTAHRGARGAAGGAEPREPPGPDRVLRHLAGAGRLAGGLDGRVRGRRGEEGALPQVRASASVEGQDDYAMMAEVVSRRFARLGVSPGADGYDESFAATPSLVVVDGGKGQLAAALEAMAAFDLPRVAAIALAKREEEVFVPGRARPVPLARDSAGLQLLQRLRDEAHRFALGFHRSPARRPRPRVAPRRAPGRRPGAQAGAAAPLRLGRAAARGDERRARGRSGDSAPDGPRDPRRAAQDRRACRRRRQSRLPGTGSGSPSGGTNVSLIVRGLTQRIRFHIEPALSFVPDARAPPNGC